ncbi:hypothetical protein ACFSLT_24915 [Novosphingobium resinovorum]
MRKTIDVRQRQVARESDHRGGQHPAAGHANHQVDVLRQPGKATPDIAVEVVDRSEMHQALLWKTRQLQRLAAESRTGGG